MPAIVNSVVKGSIAEELEIEQGDILISIDDYKLRDMIDYNFYCKNEEITICLQKTNGEYEEIELEKDYDEDLGIVFESAVFDRIKPCQNHCIFCFVDQQPKGLRDTLYIKDDDYRLSYLQGTYITLTNLKEEDKQRISSMYLGPLYVSVQTTNPELRAKMLRNPNAAKIMDDLNWLRKSKIPFHAQIVLCPGYNDGEELKRTLDDLKTLKNTVLSVAIVPLGLTKFREKSLTKVDKKVALETIEIASQYKRVCCSDEFFLLAEKEIPPAKYYGDFSQLSDGVGGLRLLLEDFKTMKLPKKIKEKKSIAFGTSYAAKIALEEISKKLNKITNLTTTVYPVKSTFWGDGITVAGLITSEDLYNTLKNTKEDIIALPSIMLKPYTTDFLDGTSLENLKKRLNKEFLIIKNSNSVKEVVDYIHSLT